MRPEPPVSKRFTPVHDPSRFVTLPPRTPERAPGDSSYQLGPPAAANAKRGRRQEIPGRDLRGGRLPRGGTRIRPGRKKRVAPGRKTKQTEITVKVGEEFKITDSNLVVKTGPFLPNFKMSADTITSTSNDPGNPAIGVEIYENDAKVFPTTGKWGWLYANFPTIHSFEHSRYGLALKEGIKK